MRDVCFKAKIFSRPFVTYAPYESVVKVMG